MRGKPVIRAMRESNTMSAPTAELEPCPPPTPPPTAGRRTAFDRPRDWLDNRFVYAVLSSRAGGLSLGLNLNPDRRCNFDCCYCEVNRRLPAPERKLDVKVMAQELARSLQLVRQGLLRFRPGYQSLSPDLLQLRHVALSGDGEPTLAPDFVAAVQAVMRVRALKGFFKIVLLTNGAGLDRPGVSRGLGLLTEADEIWIKLDGGTQSYVDTVNRPDVPLAKILANILLVARQRPVIIQSLFPALRGADPPWGEIEAYILRLQELQAAGARIGLVQIYSAARPAAHSDWGHVPLHVLSRIAQAVRQATGLRAEFF